MKLVHVSNELATFGQEGLMARFIADGEFGTKIVEADTFDDAANQIAGEHVGFDGDGEICRDPFWFSITAIDKSGTVEFQAEWSPEDGLKVERLR